MTSARGADPSTAMAAGGSSRSFSPTRVTGSRGSTSVTASSQSPSSATGQTNSGSPSSAGGSGIRLGGGETSSNQVMLQAAANTVARPVPHGGARRRPTAAYVNRTATSNPSAAPIRTAVVARPGGSRTLTPSITETTQRVPTVAQVRSRPEWVTSEPPEPMTELPPLPELPPMTELEKFRTQGFNIHEDGQGGDFIFIVDRSQSMSDDNKLVAAKEALEKTLEKMGPDQKYYIYFFSDDTMKMNEGTMLKAVPNNVSGTVKWVEAMTPEGNTNPRDALTHAFGVLKPSTIWLLSDGKFSWSKRVKSGHRTRTVRLPPVPDVIRVLNKSGHVRINTIGFSESEEEVDSSLKGIANENGGTYKFIQSKQSKSK